MNWIKTALATLTLSLVGAVLVSSGSSYANSISAPFDSGSSWYICQGYNGPVTHSGSSSLSLDFTKQLCDGGTTSNASSGGVNVRAPLDGTVYWYGAAYGSMCINTYDGRSIGLTHINSSLKAGNIVTQDQIVGTIGAAGTVGNGGIAHLHLQMWSTSNCFGSQIPFDTTNGAKICGAPDMPVLGPNYYNNGTWSGLLFVAESCLDTGEGAVYRFWSPKNQHHFYTASRQERDVVVSSYPSNIWTYEGVAFSTPVDEQCSTTASVYRFWSNKNQSHFYTVSPEERDVIIASYDPNVWKYEGIAYCAYPAADSNNIPVYRFWSNKLQGHFYTSNAQEKDVIVSSYDQNTWKYEGVAYYVKK